MGAPSDEPIFELNSSARDERPLRVDARRSLDALLLAAAEVFLTAGVDAPVRQIAERAGVGIATVYRRFPQRADLIAAVFRREIDACADAAPSLAETNSPFDALAKWMDGYVDLVATKRGLAKALHSDEPAYVGFPAYRDQRLGPALHALLSAAKAAGEIRAEVPPGELLDAVSRLCITAQPDQVARARRMVTILLDGLRYGASNHRKR